METLAIGILVSTRFGNGIIGRLPYAKRGPGTAYVVRMLDGEHEGRELCFFAPLYGSDEEWPLAPLVHGPEEPKRRSIMSRSRSTHELLYKFTIRYQCGSYRGTDTVYCNTDDQDVAIGRMWRKLAPTLSMAYQSAHIVSCEEVAE